MKIAKSILLFTWILLFPSYSYSQPQGPDHDVIVGDTAMFGVIRADAPTSCTDYTLLSVGYSHQPNKDFALIIPNNYQGSLSISVGFSFTPKRVGEQVDTMSFSFEWSGRCATNAETSSGPIPLQAVGISDSISLVKFINYYGALRRVAAPAKPIVPA